MILRKHFFTFFPCFVLCLGVQAMVRFSPAVESKVGADDLLTRIENDYDHGGRRIRKKVLRGSSRAWTPVAENLYHYDTVLLDGSPATFGVLTAQTTTIHATGDSNARTFDFDYLWGLDSDGTYQGLGGVGGLLSVKENNSGRTFVPTMDAKGNITGFVDAATKTMAATFEYTPYGRILHATYADDETELILSQVPFRFQSKVRDPETGLYYFGFRWYDPSTTKWLTRDPIEEQGGLNLYGYCKGDPVNNCDVLGCDTKVIGAGLGYDSQTGYFTYDPMDEVNALLGFGRKHVSTQNVAYELQRLARSNMFYDMSNVPFYLNPMLNGTSLYVIGAQMSGVLPYILTISAIAGEATGGVALIVSPDATGITKVGGGILVADAVDKLQSLFTGATGYERLVGTYGSESDVRTSMMIKEGAIIVLLAGTALPKSWQAKQLFGSNIANSVPKNLQFARVMPKEFALRFQQGTGRLGSPSQFNEVFVTTADELASITSRAGVQQRLSLFLNEAGTIPNLTSDAVVVFKIKSPIQAGLRSPIQTIPPRGYGFVPGGRTLGKAPEFLMNVGTAQELGAYDIMVILLQ